MNPISAGIFMYKFVNRRMYILLIQEKHDPTLGWGLPGGKSELCAYCIRQLNVPKSPTHGCCDRCESKQIGNQYFEYTAIREFNEEMGLVGVDAMRQFGGMPSIMYQWHYCLLFVKAEDENIDQKFAPNNEVSSAAWFLFDPSARYLSEFARSMLWYDGVPELVKSFMRKKDKF